jgi:hypothetical protein
MQVEMPLWRLLKSSKISGEKRKPSVFGARVAKTPKSVEEALAGARPRKATSATQVDGRYLSRVLARLEAYDDWTKIPTGRPDMRSCPVCQAGFPLSKTGRSLLRDHLKGHGLTQGDAEKYIASSHLRPTYKSWSKSLPGSDGCKRDDWFPCPLCDNYFVNGLLKHLGTVHKCPDPGAARARIKGYGEYLLTSGFGVNSGAKLIPARFFRSAEAELGRRRRWGLKL